MELFEQATSAVVGALIGALATVTGAAYRKRQRLRRNYPSIRVVRLDEIRAWHHERRGMFARLLGSSQGENLGLELLNRLIALDRQLGVDRGPLHEGTAEQWAPVFMAHPQTWALLASGPGKLVGYWHFACLDELYYGRARAGKLFDYEITAATVEDLSLPGTYNAYFTLFGVLEEYRGETSKLVKAFKGTISELASDGKFFREICANAITDDGVLFCQRLKMIEVGAHEDSGRVFCLVLNPWPNNLRGGDWTEIEEIYKRHFANPQT